MNIVKFLRPVTWIEDMKHGYACGYIGVSSDHPWFGMDSIDIDVAIHGGVTFASDKLPGYEAQNDYWFIGFDTNHCGDTLENCSRAYCQAQLDSLFEQAMKASTE